jgi:hypothetical protein
MSREVLDEAGPGVERPAPAPSQPMPSAWVLDLDAPAAPPSSPAPAPDAEPQRGSSRLREALDPRREGPVGWWRSPWAVVAAAATGALVATVLTGGVMNRQQEAARLAAVRLVADLEPPQSTYNRDRDQGLIDLDLIVYNAGQDGVEVLDATFPGTTGTTIGVREDTAVPAGDTVRVPAQLRLDCSRPLPRSLELRVRTQDDRTRSVRPSSLVAAMYSGDALDSISWMCSPGGRLTQIDIWSTTARDDGSLSMQLRNPSDKPVQIEFTGPAGTTILTDPPSPITVDARDSAFLALTVRVDRCTAAAQRAAAADDVLMHVDGDVWGNLWADSPSVLAGWFARSVALECR